MKPVDEVFGIHHQRLRSAITLLCRGWQPFDELVRATAAPRRTVEELLEALGDDLERDQRSVRLRPTAVANYAGYQESDASETDSELLATISGLIERVPPPLAALDHVQATPETVLRRALWLAGNYDLARARTLFLGDHDLTSLAVHALRPDARLTVVDLDERVLEYVDRLSGGAVTTLHADLRVGLPPAVLAGAELVFSDPPYTPEGIGLFASRGVQALADPVSEGRLLLAYGYSPRHPALGAQAQRELALLGLTFEAILPDFHRYFGAQAIGSAADLYVCQPTAQARKTKKGKTGIYTHGPQSVEAGGTPATLLDSLREIAGTGAETRAADWSAPISTKGPVAIDLTADPGPWLLRVLLAANAPRVAVLLPNSHPDLADARAQAELTGLLREKYALRLLRSTPDNTHAVVVADAVPVGEANPLLTKAHGKLGNVWREALISSSDGAMTKNDARAHIERHAPGLSAHRLIDLPRHRIAAILGK
ncbi:bis-aminopropyl spermidine synthase family protein [Amycolatopsis nigrescens]|uniref:bis-aminopropyl spermidine synthase family protein n=1 Tax=Amycolatopsis nigrescens TaxID=381445 RepID=UPI000366517D|nr:bis-aminopropyl spermidine synthase family protein [Amycolatopsis nigrescens]